MPEALHIHLDAVGGVAGDMFVAALLDAFPELADRVFADLAAALPEGCGRPEFSEGVSGSIAVRRFALVNDRRHHHAHEPAGHGHDHHASHAHAHHHGGEHHDHHHGDDPASPPVRFPDIARLIQTAKLHPGTAAQAIAILRILAEAESRMHRVPLDEVHFHELADWDSLMDVVAAGSIIAALEGAAFSVSELPRGSGLVRTQHGLLPVPAPATAAILQGFRWRDDGVAGERVTPTGAAILAHLIPSGAQDPAPQGVLSKTGTGGGTRELKAMPNILRALVFAQEARVSDDIEEVIVLSFDVDDMTGEEIGVAAERLRKADGVIDLSLGARQGKKGRPLTDFRLLVRPDAFEAVRKLCFLQTATIGLRWRQEARFCLPRQSATVEIEARTLRRKTVTRPGGTRSCKVESDDVSGLDDLFARRRIAKLGEGKEECS